MSITEVNIGDEIGGTIVVFTVSYFNKEKERIYNFVGIDSKATYRLFRSDSSGRLAETDIEDSELKLVILELIRLIKEETKLKHKPFNPLSPWTR